MKVVLQDYGGILSSNQAYQTDYYDNITTTAAMVKSF